MNSFSLHIPTQIFFGPDQAEAFATAAARLGKHALLVTGGGTVERLGYLATVSGALRAAGVEVTRFTGIEPNPEAATINRAVQVLREAKADFVVALGGGSVMDAAKGIAALAHAGEDDIWPFVIGEARAFQLTGALPIAAVPTTAATASEVTPYAVISNRTVHGKSILIADFLKPKAAWLNPAHTTGLSATVTRDGGADILSHVFENYLLGGNESPLADRYSEGIMETVIGTLPRAVAAPDDLAARGDLFWAANLALNGYQTAGRRDAHFILHYLEHALSGRKPELAHGRGLATLYPAYFRWLLEKGRAVDRLAQLGERLFGITGDERTRAEGFIARFEGWLAENDLLQSLADLGFDEADYTSIAEYAVKTYGDGTQLDALGSLPVPEIVAIFAGTARQSRRAERVEAEPALA